MLGVNDRDVSCVNGSAVAKKLYEYPQSPFSPFETYDVSVDDLASTEDEDGNEYVLRISMFMALAISYRTG